MTAVDGFSFEALLDTPLPALALIQEEARLVVEQRNREVKRSYGK